MEEKKGLKYVDTWYIKLMEMGWKKGKDEREVVFHLTKSQVCIWLR